MDWDDIKAFGIVILFMFGMFALIAWMSSSSEARTTEQCKEQFGQEWVGRYEHYGSNFCLNDKGETRIPL